MSVYTLGANGRLYVGGTSARGSWPTSGAAASLTNVAHVGDVKIPLEKGKEDASSRDGAGYEEYLAALIASGVEFQIKYDPTDPGYQALEANFFNTNSATLQVAALSGDKATAGTRGFWFDAQVFKFEKTEGLKSIQTFDVMVAPSRASGTSALSPAWITVA